MTVQCDAIVIGSGQGGVPFAKALAKSGRSVYLFESGDVGGTCVNNGCTPSKSFLASAHAAGRARRASAIGVNAGVSVDFPRVMERVRGIISDYRSGSARRLERAGVHLIKARARFTGHRVVAGGDVEVAAPVIVIDTGGSPIEPPIEGLSQTPYLTNESFFSLTALPRRAIVIGGGYIGLELGQGLARCGSEVHILVNEQHVLAREEPDASALIADALRDDGVTFHFNATQRRVRLSGTGVVVETNDGMQLEADALLVATGRMPNTADLHCEASGIELDDNGTVRVDDYLRTTCEGVYAIGDAAGQPQFTHVSWEDHRRILSTLDGEPRKRDDRVLGYTVFTDPQLGRVGLTIDEARKRGIDARVETLPLSSVARAIEWNEQRGFYRMVIDNATNRIIGATLVGYEAGELAHVFIAHMEAGSTWQVLARSVYIHPTYAEGLPSLAERFRK